MLNIEKDINKEERMYNKFKDRSPYETINIIKQFFLKNNIIVIESWSINDIGLFSVTLTIDDSSLYVTGKGTSKEYALASAYGELAERTQNFALFRMSSNIFAEDIFDEEKNVFGTYAKKNAFYKDLVKLNEVSNENILTLEEMSLLEELSALEHNNTMNNYIKFSEYRGTRTLAIPLIAVDYIYGTNGMSAGNTRSEAIVQGISEILERYVAKELISGNLVPLKIKNTFLRTLDSFSDVNFYIQKIEERGQYKIELLDLSMNSKFPVVAVILINMKEASYFVKIGSHPDINIAIERCFTELMQGKNLENFYDMIDIRSSEHRLKLNYNIKNYYKNSSGAFPHSFFTAVNASDKNTFNAMQFRSNSEMLLHLTNLINELGYSIFISDTSTELMNSYHIIIPGMSETNLTNTTVYDELTQLKDSIKISNLLKNNIQNLSEDDATQILNYLESRNINKYQSIQTLLKDVCFKQPNVYSNIPVIILEFYLFLILKNYEKALHCVNLYNNYLKNHNQKNMYFDCFATFLSYMSSEISEYDLNKLLTKFYNKSIVERVIEDFNSYPFKDINNINCNNLCLKCYYNNLCLRKNNLVIYNKLKLSLLS